MRKNLVGILGILALAAILFVGYHTTYNTSGAPSAIKIATGGEAGVYYAYGNALANLLEKNMRITVTAIPSGGSADNINMLRNDRAEMAFVQNDIMTYAYNGTNIFSTEEPFRDLCAVASLYHETCQVVARRDVEGIADLRSRRVSIGAEGSGTELNALQILESYNIRYTDINVEHLGFSESVSAFRDGRIDAFFVTAGVPTPAVSQLALSGEARILSIGDARARLIISQYPYYSRQIIPAGIYPGIDGEAETVAVKATLAASGGLNEQTVSEIMKIMFENASEIKGISGAAGLSREFAMQGLSIPLHPGAEKFFLGR